MSGTLLFNANFCYCVQFLRNANERIRAIRLVVDATGLSLLQARQWVDDLAKAAPLISNREWIIECGSCRTTFDAHDQRLCVGICPVCAELITSHPKPKP